MHFFRLHYYLIIFFVLGACSPDHSIPTSGTISEIMDSVITRLYRDVPEEKYNTLDEAFILDFLTENEKQVLGTKYQYFKVNVPVRVSLMRSKSQKVVPFWMREAGFNKTDGIVKNEEYEYEVWQRDFNAGWVNLGINGFDMHRVVYFVTVGPQNPDDKLEISDYYPSQYSIETMKKGAFTYHDWSSLLIAELPQELEGQKLFTTVRGRAREAHIVGAFRKTDHPSTENPDQVMLTWSQDPTSTIDIQWRTSTTVSNGIVKYWVHSTTDTLVGNASQFQMEDRMLYNDRYVNRFTANLENLEPGTQYDYQVGSETAKVWSEVKSFKTQAEKPNGFSFVWFGDTHRSPVWGELIGKVRNRHDDIAFYCIAGDLVSTGLYRNEWDELFANSQDAFAWKPLMPVPGNHDRQDGLGAWMYYELFSLPKNGPDKVAPESSYAFRYGNALFLMLDSTYPIEEQSEWIEDQLKNANATWKFAMFHFPPYNFEEPYPDIQAAWCTLFDKYHVDMVMGGHVHYYMRSKPMNNGKVVESYDKGTVYTISIGIEGNHEDIGVEPYAEQRYANGQFYQYLQIDDNSLIYTAYNPEGQVKDHFTITKTQE